jgi:hypothetical protein
MLFVGCKKNTIEQGELSNKARMNQLDISDPMVWNSLTTQTINIGSKSSGLKSGNDLNEYPSSDKYYFALFEDLYPSQGDYDFNDVVLRTKLYLDWGGGQMWGSFATTVMNVGGSLETKIGLMFYFENDGTYTRIDNSNLIVNGLALEGDTPFLMDLPRQGEDFEVEFEINDSGNIWISWFIVPTLSGVEREIHSAGFAPSDVSPFTIPQYDFLTENNLPWGLEIEAEEFAIPLERALFLDAYPFFAAWAESGGEEHDDWYLFPDTDYTK